MKIKEIIFFLFPYLSNETLRIEWVKKELIKIPRGQSLIDIGAGEMRYKKYCRHLKYKSQDFNEYKGKGDGIGLQTGKWNTKEVDIVSDISSIPVKNSSFDNVLCTEVLEHIPEPEAAIKEISRVLKKKGKLILTAPFCSQTHFSPYFFMTGFSPNWYKKIILRYNFKILKIQANGNYFDYLNQELIRLPLMVRKYTLFSFFGVFLYIIIIPVVGLFWLVSKFSKKSEEQLCFGWHVVAVKTK